MKFQLGVLHFFILVNMLGGDMISKSDLYRGKDFIPTNPLEYLGDWPSVKSTFNCALLCHKNARCRTFVSDHSLCRLYESSSPTGTIIIASSASRVVGRIRYDQINLSSRYDQTCDQCFPDRYLVCRNNRCQCPMNTFWNGIDQCVNQLFVNSSLTCQSDQWCREDLNLTCQCGQCQCPMGKFWNNQTCVAQFLNGIRCNSSIQCRNDLNLVCSRTNKTCTPMLVKSIPVINGTEPSAFRYVSESYFEPNWEWYRAFDYLTYTFWDAVSNAAYNYMLIDFNDTYLLSSLQLAVWADGQRDPKIIDVYLDEQGTCLGQSFSFPQTISNSIVTFAPKSFNMTQQPLAARRVMIRIERWSSVAVWLMELAFFGGLY